MKKKLFVTFLLLFSLWISSFAQQKREMRAVWIATVKNIDWPSKTGLCSNEQKEEMIKMLNQLQSLKMNAIFIQIRPSSDTFYASELEPWSIYLSGKQGAPPVPFYDPLRFIIEEAHKRCIEVHAWLNPYRICMSANHAELHPTHLFFSKPELFVEYGEKLYFNPAYDETRKFLNEVVANIVANYDIDAIHFDDYFYPYRVANKDFPDNDSFKANPRGFSFHQKGDWRRNNVNLIIAELQKTIKELKPWVEFGISPFGVWRNVDKDPLGSRTKTGMTNYDDLYADILKWLKEGSIDYVVPQLYWEIGKRNADYEVLIDWWNRNNFGKNLYIGLFASGLGINSSSAWQNGNELVRQMRMNLDYKNVKGVAFYSAAPFLKNPKGLLDTLRNDFYKYPALTPINSNIAENDASAPPTELKLDKKNAVLTWKKSEERDGCTVAYYVIYAFEGKESGNMNDPKSILRITTDNFLNLTDISHLKGEYTLGVSSVNRYKKESRLTLLEKTTFLF